MRATCGVVSARTPSVRPESWSTSLKVFRSSSRPVPESSDSRCSSSGGITSSQPYPAATSSRPRRSSSMCLACAGSTSATCSGRSQAEDMRTAGCEKRIVRAAPGTADRARASEQHDAEQQQSRRQPDEPEEAQLPVAHAQRALEDLTPRPGAQERHETFAHEHQGDGAQREVPKAGAHYFFFGAAEPPDEEDAGPRSARKKSVDGSTIITSERLRNVDR